MPQGECFKNESSLNTMLIFFSLAVGVFLAALFVIGFIIGMSLLIYRWLTGEPQVKRIPNEEPYLDKEFKKPEEEEKRMEKTDEQVFELKEPPVNSD